MDPNVKLILRILEANSEVLLLILDTLSVDSKQLTAARSNLEKKTEELRQVIAKLP